MLFRSPKRSVLVQTKFLRITYLYVAVHKDGFVVADTRHGFEAINESVVFRVRKSTICGRLWSIMNVPGNVLLTPNGFWLPLVVLVFFPSYNHCHQL
jgi:hypothetical protein